MLIWSRFASSRRGHRLELPYCYWAIPDRLSPATTVYCAKRPSLNRYIAWLKQYGIEWCQFPQLAMQQPELPDDGTTRLTAPKYPDVASLAGAAGTLSEPMDWAKMKEIAREDRFEAKHKDV